MYLKILDFSRLFIVMPLFKKNQIFFYPLSDLWTMQWEQKQKVTEWIMDWVIEINQSSLFSLSVMKYLDV